jgi:hypothetical protein
MADDLIPPTKRSDITPHAQHLNLENLEKIKGLKEGQLELLKDLKNRIAKGAFSIHHMDMFHVYREIFKDSVKEMADLEKLLTEAKEKGVLELNKDQKKIIKEELELDGDIDSQFAIMIGTFVFILRALHVYYLDKERISEILFGEDHKKKFSKFLSEDTFYRFIKKMTKYEGAGITTEHSQGPLVQLASTLMNLAEAEGASETVLKRRRHLHNLFGSDLKKIIGEKGKEAKKDKKEMKKAEERSKSSSPLIPPP